MSSGESRLRADLDCSFWHTPINGWTEQRILSLLARFIGRQHLHESTGAQSTITPFYVSFCQSVFLSVKMLWLFQPFGFAGCFLSRTCSLVSICVFIRRAGSSVVYLSCERFFFAWLSVSNRMRLSCLLSGLVSYHNCIIIALPFPNDNNSFYFTVPACPPARHFGPGMESATNSYFINNQCIEKAFTESRTKWIHIHGST